MDLPFILSKDHKRHTKYNWMKKNNLKGDFEEIYNKYIYATHCELCNKEFTKPTARHMDHCHETGKFRNIVCSGCNQRKYDRKVNSNNTSGHRHIYKQIDKKCIQGFMWFFKVSIDGKLKKLISSIDLQTVIDFKDEWFEDHPEYFT